MTKSDHEKYKEKKRKYMREYRKKNKAIGKRINTTLFCNEYTELKRSAKKFKTSPTRQLKNLAFEHLDNQNEYPFEVQKSLAILVNNLREAGNNINQIAKNSNTKKRLIDEEKALKHLVFLEEEIQKFLNENK